MKASFLIKTLISGFFIFGSLGFSKAQTNVNLPEQCDCDTAFLVQDTLLVVGKDTINLSVLDTHLDKVLVSNDYIYYYVNGMVVDSTKISEIIDVGTGSGPPTVSGTEDIGEVYIDYATGDIWTFDGTTWVLQDGGVTTGTGAPAVAGTEDAGDVYVDNSTGDIWTFDGTTWVLQDGGVTTGTGAPAVAGTEDAGDVYVDNSTGDIWTFDGTTWVLQNGGVTTGTGAPAVAGTEDAGDVYVDNSTGDIWTFDGTTWVLQDGGVTTGTGAPAVAGTEDAGDVYVDNSTGDIWTFDGTTWVLQDGGVTTGAGAPAVAGTEDAGDVYVDNSTGDIWTFDGTTWVLQDGGVTTGAGAPSVTGTEDDGDIYIDNVTGDTYSFDALTDTWNLINSGDPQDLYWSAGNDSLLITNGEGISVEDLGTNIVTTQIFNDSVVSIIYNQGDTLLSNPLFTDSLYSFISDSLLSDTAWLTELSDSIDTDVDSLTLTGSDLTVYEDGVGYTVNLSGLATDPAFADSLLTNNYFTDSLTSIIQDSLLANETFITNLGDTLITNQAFYDSIVSIVYNQGDTLLSNPLFTDSLYSFISDSLLNDVTWLTELSDSIDTDVDSLTLTGSDLTVYEDGVGYTVNLAGLATDPAFADSLLTNNYFTDSLTSIIQDSLLANETFITNLGDTLITNQAFYDSIVSIIYNEGDTLIENDTWVTELIDSLTQNNTYLTELRDSIDQQDLYWSTGNDSLLITNGEGISVEDLGTNIVTTQIFNDSVVSIIYNQGDTLLSNPLFTDSLYSFISDSLLSDTAWLTELSDSIDTDVDSLTLTGSDLTVYEDGVGYTVNLSGLATDPAFADSLLTNNYFTDSLTSIIQDSLLANETFITNLGDTLITNQAFYDSIVSIIYNEGDTLIENDTWVTELIDSLTQNNTYLTELRDSIDQQDLYWSVGNDSLLITNGEGVSVEDLGTNIVTTQIFNDSVVSIIYNQGDTLLSNPLFTDSLYSFISDSLLSDTAWLTELSDSIDTDVDSLTLTGSDLTVYEDGVGYTVNLAGLATDPAFADSLLANNYFTDSLTSIIQDSLLANETFITNLGDTLITNQAFYDSIVSIIYNEGDTLIENDTWVTELIDSLTQNNTYLTELRDSIDQQDLYWSTGNDSLLITNGEGISVEDLGTNIVTTQIFNDSVVSIIYNQGDTLLSNPLFTDSLYSFISDSLLNDVTWLTELSDSIDTDVDSLTLTGSDLTVYEDGVGYTVNLSGLATDPAFADSLLTNNYFTDSLTSIIQDSLLANETFITNLGDTLITNQAFYDSIVSIVYNQGDTLLSNPLFTDSLYSFISDSLLNDVTWLTELSDSIDTDVDSLTLTGSDLTVYEDGVGYTVNLAGLATDPAFADSLLTNNYFTDSLTSIIQDSLLANETFITNLGDTLITNQAFYDSIVSIIYNEGDTLIENDTWVTELIDSLTQNNTYLTELRDSIDQQDLYWSTGNDSLLITNGEGISVEDLGTNIVTTQIFNDSVVSIIYNQGDTLLSNPLFTDSLYSFISDSLLNDVTWLTEISDSIDTDVDSLTLTGSDLTVYEDGVGYTVNLAALATDPAFADSLLANNYFTDSLTSIIQDSLLANETFITNLGDTLITNQAFYDSIVSIIYNEGDTLIENDTWVTELIDSLTQNNTYLTELRDSIDQQDLYWSTGNDSLLITNGEGISVEDLGTNIVTTQIFNDSVVSIIYNQGDTLLSNPLFTDSLYSFISDSLLNDVTWLTELSDSIDTDVDSLTLTGSDLTVYEDGVGYTVNLSGLATDPAFADSLLTNNYFTDSLTSIIQDSLLANETFITNLGDTLITNQAFYDSIVSIIYNEGDTLIENDTWVTELIDSLTQNNTYLTELRDSIDQQDLYWSTGNDSLLITNGEGISVEDMSTNIVTTQIFNDSVVSIIYNQGDTLLDNPLFTDSLYSFISDSLLSDTAWLTELSDSIDTDVDSLTLTGSDLTVYEDGVGYTVNLAALATDPVFADSLLTNNYYTDSLTNIIRDSLLANETFITNIGDTLLQSNTWVTELIDSLTQNNTYLTELRDSIDQQDLYWSAGNDSLLITNGEGVSVEDLGTNIVTTQIFNDSVVSIIYNQGDTLLSNPLFTDSLYSFISDSLLSDTAWLTEISDSIDTDVDSLTLTGSDLTVYEDGVGYTVNLAGLATDPAFADSLLANNYFTDSLISIIQDSLLANETFITNLGDTLITNQAFYDSIVSIIYNEGDTLIENDTWVTELIDSLTQNNTYLTELRDSIDQQDLYWSAGNDSLLITNGEGISVEDLGTNIVTTQIFNDSVVSIIYNQGDTLLSNPLFTDSLYSFISDSLLSDTAWLTELSDSIDTDVDSLTLTGSDLTVYEDGVGYTVNLAGLATDPAFADSLLTNNYFTDSLTSIIQDSLLANETFITNLGDTLITNQAFYDSIVSIIYNEGDTLIENDTWVTELIDSLTQNNTYLTELRDSIDQQNLYWSVGNDSLLITNGEGISVEDLGTNIVTTQIFNDSVVSIIYNQGDTLLSNPLFTDSLYSFISDSLLSDTAWLTELSDSIDTDVDSLTLTGSDLTVYEDGVGYTVNLAGLATDPAFADSLLTNNYFTDSLTSIIQDSLLANETFITNLGDTLITNQAFYDSIVSIIYNEGDTLIENDTWVTELIDSLTQNNTYLTELRDSIDQQDLYWSAGNDSLLITNGEGISVEDLGTNIVTTQIFNDSVVSIIYNQGDTLLDNPLFTDSLYSFISDSLLNDVTWLTELSDSIDTDVDSLTLTGSDLTVYEDGVGYTVNLAGLATDPAFSDSLLTNNYYTDSLISIIQDSLLANETFITNLGDTLITNEAFTDSIYSFVTDSIVNDNTFLSELQDSIDTHLDSVVNNGDTALIYYVAGVPVDTTDMKGLTSATEPWIDELTATGALPTSDSIYFPGRVAIGTTVTEPGKALTVAGDLKVTGVVDPTKLVFSDGSPSSFDPAANDQYEIEYGTRRLVFRDSLADHFRMTQKGQLEVLNTGQSVFVGEGAGENDDLANRQNVFVGYHAGNNNTTGSQNAAYGYNALYTNATGQFNTAYGHSALYFNETGWNTAYGAYSLYNNTTGIQNTGSGVTSLYSNTSGSQNSGYGYSSLYSNTTGDNNTAIGIFSLRYKQAGNNNTAVGYHSGHSVSSGSDFSNNSLFGYRAGYNLITGGNNNLLFGYSTGDNITTGANNLIIGFNIDAPVPTGSNQLSIGNLIFGTGIDGTGTAVSSGNIGIGVTTPDNKLHVAGDVKIEDMASGAGTDSVVVWSPADSVLKVVSAASIGGADADWTGAGTGTMIQGDTTDQVVIGSATASPGKALTVAGDMKVTGVVDPTKLIFSDGSTASFDPATNDAYEIEFDSRDLRFTNSNTETAVVIKQDGKVGIGTDSPKEILDVRGSLRLQDSSDFNNWLQINPLARYIDNPDADAEDQEIVFGWDDDDRLHFLGYYWNGNNVDTIMTLHNRGNIGMGTINPTGKLHVDIDNDGGADFFISNSGGSKYNVGIGTNNPEARLAICKDLPVSTEEPLLVLRNTGLGGENSGSSIQFKRESFHHAAIAGLDDLDAKGRLEFRVDSVGGNTSPLSSAYTKMIIKNTGNVGIGTLTPNKKLHVSSTSDPLRLEGLVEDISYKEVLVVNPAGVVHKAHIDSIVSAGADADWSGAGTGSMYATNATDRVGIGTSTPSFRLELAGTTTTADRKMGINGTQVVYLPDQALTSGSLVYGTGGNSMNSSSNGNTLMGIGSGLSLTSGIGNTAIGNNALSSDTASIGNTAVGYQALQNSINNYNTALGYKAGMGTSGSTGTFNTFIGSEAGISIQTGRANVAIGHKAGTAITTNHGNTIVGFQSGLAVLGSNNTLLGAEVGDNITTGFSNIIIGHDIDAQSATGNNQLSIGNVIFGSGGFGTGTVVGAGNIGIGRVPSLGHKLEVQGTAGLTSGTTWTNISDERLKDITGEYTYGLDKIIQLRPVIFNYKAENPLNLPSDKKQVGFIAQEVQKIFPEAVSIMKSGYLDFNMHSINVAFVNAIKELNTKVEAAKTDAETIQTLQNEVDYLKKELEALKAVVINKEVEKK